MVVFWIFIGLVVGFAMALTGAGGGILSIPLFVQLLGKTYHEATFLSLLALICSAGLAWVFQVRHSHIRLGLMIAATSGLTSFWISDLKAQLPEIALQIGFLTVCLLSGIALFLAPKTETALSPRTTPCAFLNFFRIIGAGVILGTLITLTGLGGGTLLVPLYFKLFRFPLHEAIATALFSTLLASIASFWAQKEIMEFQLDLVEISALIFGVLMTSSFIGWIVKKTGTDRLTPYRKWLFVGIVFFAVISTLFQIEIFLDH
jgi:uncharacterized protein